MREPGWREWPVAARVHAAKQRRRGERGRQMRNVYTYMKTTNTRNNGVSNRYVYVHTHVYRQAGAFSTWAVRLCARTYSYISWAHPTLGITARCAFSFSPSPRLVPALPLPPTLPTQSFHPFYRSTLFPTRAVSFYPSFHVGLSSYPWLKAVLLRSTWMNSKSRLVVSGRVSNRAEATRPTPKVLPRSCRGSRDPLGARQTDTTPLLGRKRTARGHARAKNDDTLTARQLSFRDAYVSRALARL